MRKVRKEIEEYFCQRLLGYFHRKIDANAEEIPGIIDRPDLAIQSAGRKIAIELSQIPSSYIIRHFHKQVPPATYRRNEIVGSLTAYPFEPHRWVYEVIQRKAKTAKICKHRGKADEVWLAIHAQSATREWPMSKTENSGRRKFESELMRFGTKGQFFGFDRIIYIYADGTVVGLTGNKEIIPKRFEIEGDDGYPAVTHHSFCFAFDVPLPGLGQRIFEFDNVRFDEKIIAPRDDWMMARGPKIARPKLFIRATVDSEIMKFEMFLDGKKNLVERATTDQSVGKTMKYASVMEMGIQQVKYRAIV